MSQNRQGITDRLDAFTIMKVNLKAELEIQPHEKVDESRELQSGVDYMPQDGFDYWVVGEIGEFAELK
ncbi:MAG: DUF1003 domain-containing protein [Acidobacteriota bacterium]|nr:DUF1003 domain-containing protein [Acidobacteriota bacterium]